MDTGEVTPMSRRDYIRAAQLVREARYLEEEQRVQLFEDLCEWCKADNPRFCPDRFFAACVLADVQRRAA
jgi:hypothetical protein